MGRQVEIELTLKDLHEDQEFGIHQPELKIMFGEDSWILNHDLLRSCLSAG